MIQREDDLTQKNVIKLVEYWKDSSDFDFKAAVEIANKTKQYLNVLFLLHLSLEKALKAYYVFKFKEHAPYTHNLIHLAGKLEITEIDLKILSEVNEFNLRCRYPDDKFEIYKVANKKMVIKMLKYTKEARAWIFSKLS